MPNTVNQYVLNSNDAGAINSGNVIYSQNLLNIEKNITYRAANNSTNILNIEKQIVIHTSGSILNIEKNIISTVKTFYQRNGWEPFVVLGGALVPTNQLCESIKVVKTEDENHTASFVLLLPIGTYNLYTYQGASVQIFVHIPAGIFCIFTGIVDYPQADVMHEKLTLNCISDRRQLLNNLAFLEPYIGIYNQTILGTSTNTYEQINNRLLTVPQSLDFDSYNNYSLNNWLPKASPDFTYDSTGVYRRKPELKLQSSSKIINQINITFDYTYQRCHHREITWNWTHTYAPFDPVSGTGAICPFLQYMPSMPKRAMITSAVQSAGWPVRGQISFGRIFAAGTFFCNGAWYGWGTGTYSGSNGVMTDGNGNAVTDAVGNVMYQTSLTSYTDYANLYTMSASWVGSTQFKQTIKEVYTVTVQAPVSISTYGTLPQNEKYSVIDSNQLNDWEKYPSWKPPPTTIYSTDKIYPVWQPNFAYNQEDIITPTVSNGYRYQCTVSGTSNTIEPSWGTTIGGNTTDNSVTWTLISSLNLSPVFAPNNTSPCYFFNGDGDRFLFNTAYLCALNKAKTLILKNHRDTSIVFQRFITPQIELMHTIQLTGKWMQGKGKCHKITHVMVIAASRDGTDGDAYTEVELLQYRGSSFISDDVLSLPAAITDTPNVQMLPINLQTHLGLDPSKYPGASAWTGYIGNIRVTTQVGATTNTKYTQFQEAFVVDTPAIESTNRDVRTLTQINNYNVNIPTDSTTYTTYGLE